MKLKPVREQVIVVMGASSGIGRETALQAARRGARVVVAARGEAGLESLVREIRSFGGEATAVPADVLSYDQVQHVADVAVQAYGRMDTWVHSAAVMLAASFADTTPEEFKQVIDINLVGQAYGAKAALSYMRPAANGVLIFLSSAEGLHGLPLQSAYSASKHGILGMADAIRTELEHEGLPISVTSIMPGTINTPFYGKARTKLGVKPRQIPPVLQPEVVAKAILYAAEHPTRHVFAGAPARVFGVLEALSPRLLDKIMLLIGYSGARTEQPKSAAAPDNLFGPIEGFDRSRGELWALPFSPYTALQTNPLLKWSLAGLSLAAAVGTGIWTLMEERKSSSNRGSNG